MRLEYNLSQVVVVVVVKGVHNGVAVPLKCPLMILPFELLCAVPRRRFHPAYAAVLFTLRLVGN